jgi:hypothetical protein
VHHHYVSQLLLAVGAALPADLADGRLLSATHLPYLHASAALSAPRFLHLMCEEIRNAAVNATELRRNIYG